MKLEQELRKSLEFGSHLCWTLYTISFCVILASSHQRANAENQHSLHDRVALAVAKPLHDGGDTSLDLWCTVVQSLISTRLRELSGLRVIDDVGAAQQVINSTNSALVGDQLARKLGKLLGAHWVVSMDLQRSAEKWSITAWVINTYEEKSSNPIATASSDLLEAGQLLTMRIASEVGRPANAQEETRMKLRWNYSLTELRLFGKASQLLAQGYPLEEAELYLRQVVKLQPAVADAYITLAEVLRRQGKLAGAEDAAISAVKLSPESSSTHRRLGFVLCSEKRFSEAENELRTAARLDPDEGETHMALANTCSGEGFLNEALEEFRTAIRLSPYAYFAEDVKTRIARLESALPMARFDFRPPMDYTTETYSEALSQKLEPAEAKLVINPLGTDPSMQNWARQLLKSADSQETKAKQLFAAFVRRNRNVSWRTPPTPRSAREVFELWNSSEVPLYCQDLAFLYTVSARAVGLKAYDVLVLEACNGSKAWHCCTAVYLDGKAVLADPLYPVFGVNHKRFVLLDDVEATGLYMSGLPDFKRTEIGYKLAPNIALAQLSHLNNSMKLRHWSEACESLRRVRELDVDGAIGDYAEAKLALSQNETARAISLAGKAIAVDPLESEYHMLLTEAYAQAGNIGAAVQSCSNALKFALPNETSALLRDFCLHTNKLRAFGLHGRGLAQSREGDLSGALATLTEAIQLDPGTAPIYADRAQIEGKMGNQAAALADFNKALSLSPELAQDYTNWVKRTQPASNAPRTTTRWPGSTKSALIATLTLLLCTASLVVWKKRVASKTG